MQQKAEQYSEQLAALMVTYPSTHGVFEEQIKTVTALGGYAMTAVTAITAQNTTGVNSVVPIPPKEIAKQILFTSKG